MQFHRALGVLSLSEVARCCCGARAPGKKHFSFFPLVSALVVSPSTSTSTFGLIHMLTGTQRNHSGPTEGCVVLTIQCCCDLQCTGDAAILPAGSAVAAESRCGLQHCRTRQLRAIKRQPVLIGTPNRTVGVITQNQLCAEQVNVVAPNSTR